MVKMKFIKASLILTIVLSFCCSCSSVEQNNSSNMIDKIKTPLEYDNSAMSDSFDYITFGKYEQDNNESNGKEDIEWIVLKKEGNNLYLLSKYVIDNLPYEDEYSFRSWEESTLRKWLNEEFLNAAFDEKEKKAILIKSYNNRLMYDDRSVKYESSATEDKISLLDIEEAEEFFGHIGDDEESRFHNKKLSAYATEFLKKKNDMCAWKFDDWYKGCAKWWLRTMYADEDADAEMGSWRAWAIDFDASAYKYKYSNEDIGVRPAMWIDASNLETERIHINTSKNDIKKDESKNTKSIMTWEKEHIDYVIDEIKKETIEEYKKNINSEERMVPLYNISDSKKVTFTYGFKDLDENGEAEMIIYLSDYLYRVYSLEHYNYNGGVNTVPQICEGIPMWNREGDVVDSYLMSDDFMYEYYRHTYDKEYEVYVYINCIDKNKGSIYQSFSYSSMHPSEWEYENYVNYEDKTIGQIEKDELIKSHGDKAPTMKDYSFDVTIED